MARQVDITRSEIFDVTVGPDDFRPDREGDNTRRLSGCVGSPEGRIVGEPGDVCISDLGLFSKVTGRGTVGWVPVGSGGPTGTAPEADVEPVALRPLVVLNEAEFTWFNEHHATVEVGDAVFLRVNPSEGHEVAGRSKAAPAPPYEVVAGIMAHVLDDGLQSAGLLWRDPVSGVLDTVVLNSLGRLGVERWVATTAPLGIESVGLRPTGLLWLRLTDDGIFRRAAYSFDGLHFINFYIGATAGFSEIGYCARATAAVCDVGLSILSWEEK